ncbi:MAG: glycosyltransferase family 4 protein [Geobacteraceae bacterium]|nr:glycosyltransferase family 4 protein [Geobacteraceae bacterium]
MKIALIRQKYTPFGGAERYMARLVAGLASAGHKVHILAAEWDDDRATAVSFHRVPIVKKPGWFKSLTFSRGCRTIIEREHFDVVFSLERTLRQDIYRAGDGCHRQWLTQKSLGKGLLYKVWTWLNPLQLAYVWLERRMFTDLGLKAIIANSQRGKDDIIRLYGVDPGRIHVVYNGIDPVAWDQERKLKYRKMLADEFRLGDELRILYVGSGFKRKGVAAAIRAAARLTVPFRFFIVGKGNVARYRRLAKQMGIHEWMIFTGPRKDVELFYQGSDLFVFPTLYDPFSNATLEAMAHGLPVITSRFNGVSELIRQGDNGFVVQDPLDDAAVFDCMHALTEPGRRRYMGGQAAVTASAFTMQRNVQETLAVIYKVFSPPAADTERLHATSA